MSDGGRKGTATTPRGWNHNIHYGRRLLRLVPSSARDALDVGCGEGWLARELRERVDHVVGIDPDAGSIAQARAQGQVGGLEYLQQDLLAWQVEPASFDVVTAVASLHHLDEQAALQRMAELLRPGGLLGVVGLARSRSVRDFAYDIGGTFATRAYKCTRTRTHWETPAPKAWPPPHTYDDLRSISTALLPNRQFRRGAMFRYILTWTKPTN